MNYILLKTTKADEIEFVTDKGQSDTEQWLFYNIQFTANEHFVSIYFDVWKKIPMTFLQTMLPYTK